MSTTLHAEPGSPARISALDVVKANHGRDFGWFIERDGVVIGQLTDERFADMFWSSYALEPLGDTDEQRRLVYDPEPWRKCALTFRNRVTGDRVTNAISAGAPSEDQPRINMRFLYLLPKLSRYERLQLGWWKRQRDRGR